MSVPVIFGMIFLLLFGITLGFPGLPPGNTVYPLLGIPELSLNVLGFSSEVLVKGVINGVLWGILVALIYGLGSRLSNRNVIIVPVKSSIPPPMPAAPIKLKSTPTPRVRRINTYVTLDQDVETIEGIGPTYGSRLRVNGVMEVSDLLHVGSTWKGRQDLADHVGVAPKVIYKWVNQADFHRIRGIGKQYADLLDAAGVNTVIDLSTRNPKLLYKRLRDTNNERNLVKRTPPYRTINGWIQSAKRLTPVVEL